MQMQSSYLSCWSYAMPELGIVENPNLIEVYKIDIIV
jgi:hypothetical protein